jgi:hypothetical protein
MNQPKDAFNQVKAILGKLDRSITEARSRRLGEVIEEEVEEAPAQRSHTPPAAETPPPAPPQPAQQPSAGYARLRGQFGRAKPMKPGPMTNP